jgi:hypothetical protein
MAAMRVLLDAAPQGQVTGGILSLVIPLSCLFLVLAWWGWIIRRRGGLP